MPNTNVPTTPLTNAHEPGSPQDPAGHAGSPRPLNLVVTGGTGFIGTALLRRAFDAATEPLARSAVVLTRNAERARSTLGSTLPAGAMDAIRCVSFDPTAADSGRSDAVQAALAEADAVVNLAGEPVLPARWTDAKKRRLVESRVGLTKRLVTLLEEADVRPRVLVSASAVGFYGHDAGDAPCPESTPPGGDFLAQLCVEWESAARRAEALGIDVRIVRVGLVLGPDGGALAQLLTPFKLGVGGRLGSGRQYMPWIHREDVVGLFLAAARDPSFPPVVNGAAPQPVTNAEFTDTLGHVLHRPTVLPVPSFALRAALGEAASALLGGQRAVPEAALAHGFEFAFSDLEACLRDILA